MSKLAMSFLIPCKIGKIFICLQTDCSIMDKNEKPEPSSGFIIPEEIVKSDDFTEYAPLPSKGVFQLTRAKRQGRWWMLKGLQKKYHNDSIYRAFLEKEYEIASQLQHPMMVSVHSLEEVKGLGLCIVMEWIEGTTLGEWLMAGNPTRKQRRHVAEMLLEALIYVHSRQTQHRDLKPSNIMVTHNGQYLKLIDFGLSDTDSHTVLKAPAGTEGYMAPEGPSDIYSLGVILSEMRLGWTSSLVARRCRATLHRRYHDLTTVQIDLQRAWHWPLRMIYVAVFAILVAVPYLFNLSRTQQGLMSVTDSLKTMREESNAMINAQKAKSDSIERQMRQFNQEQPPELSAGQPSGQSTESHAEMLTEIKTGQEAIQQHERQINEEKRKIDQRIKQLGIEPMMATLSCQLHAHIPFVSILQEMMNETEEPELKEYIETRYRQPLSKRFHALPWN